MLEFDLPKSARVDRIVPKTKFYERSHVSTKIKDEFQQLIGRITWSYKLAESTLNIPSTENIIEIQIFQIELKQKQLPMKALAVIDKTIQYPILFVVNSGVDKCYIIQHKIDSAKRYYKTDWNQLSDLSFAGANLEAVYQRIVTSFIAVDGQPLPDYKPFDEVIINSVRRQQLEIEITALENKIKSERQFSKKVALNSQLQSDKKQLSILT